MDKEKIKECVADLKEKITYLEELIGDDGKPKSLEDLKDMANKNTEEQEDPKEKSGAY